VVCHAILKQFIVNAFQSVELVAADIPLKRNIWILRYTLPCIDGCHCFVWKLETPFDVNLVAWIDRIIVLAWRTEHCNQLVVCC